MPPKPTPNRKLYLDVLGRMSPEQRLNKAFELSETARAMSRQAIARRFPDSTPQEQHARYLELLQRCHNCNY